MTTRERIDVMIKRAQKKSEDDTWDANLNYWLGYTSALEELKLSVKPKEQSIDEKRGKK